MTRPKLAYGRQGLGWDCGPGYSSSGGYNLGSQTIGSNCPGGGGQGGNKKNVTQNDTFSLLTVGPN